MVVFFTLAAGAASTRALGLGFGFVLDLGVGLALVGVANLVERLSAAERAALRTLLLILWALLAAVCEGEAAVVSASFAAMACCSALAKLLS